MSGKQDHQKTNKTAANDDHQPSFPGLWNSCDMIFNESFMEILHPLLLATRAPTEGKLAPINAGDPNEKAPPFLSPNAK